MFGSVSRACGDGFRHEVNIEERRLRLKLLPQAVRLQVELLKGVAGTLTPSQRHASKFLKLIRTSEHCLGQLVWRSESDDQFCLRVRQLLDTHCRRADLISIVASYRHAQPCKHRKHQKLILQLWAWNRAHSTLNILDMNPPPNFGAPRLHVLTRRPQTCHQVTCRREGPNCGLGLATSKLCPLCYPS